MGSERPEVLVGHQLWELFPSLLVSMCWLENALGVCLAAKGITIVWGLGNSLMFGEGQIGDGMGDPEVQFFYGAVMVTSGLVL